MVCHSLFWVPFSFPQPCKPFFPKAPPLTNLAGTPTGLSGTNFVQGCRVSGYPHGITWSLRWPPHWSDLLDLPSFIPSAIEKGSEPGSFSLERDDLCGQMRVTIDGQSASVWLRS
jgi:hypothetical protein